MNFKELETNFPKVVVPREIMQGFRPLAVGNWSAPAGWRKALKLYNSPDCFRFVLEILKGLTLCVQTVCQITYSLSSQPWYCVRNNTEKQYKASSVWIMFWVRQLTGQKCNFLPDPSQLSFPKCYSNNNMESEPYRQLTDWVTLTNMYITTHQKSQQNLGTVVSILWLSKIRLWLFVSADPLIKIISVISASFSLFTITTSRTPGIIVCQENK